MKNLTNFKNSIIAVIFCLTLIAMLHYSNSRKYIEIINKTDCGQVDITQKYYHSSRYYYVPVNGKNYKWYIVLLDNDIKRMENTNVCKKYSDIFTTLPLPKDIEKLSNDDVIFKISLFAIMIMTIFLIIIIL